MIPARKPHQALVPLCYLLPPCARVAVRPCACVARSSRGLGRWPLTPVTRVRIPYGLPTRATARVCSPYGITAAHRRGASMRRTNPPQTTTNAPRPLLRHWVRRRPRRLPPKAARKNAPAAGRHRSSEHSSPDPTPTPHRRKQPMRRTNPYKCLLHAPPIKELGFASHVSLRKPTGTSAHPVGLLDQTLGVLGDQIRARSQPRQAPAG